MILLQLLTIIALAIRYARGDNISRDHDFEQDILDQHLDLLQFVSTLSGLLFQMQLRL